MIVAAKIVVCKIAQYIRHRHALRTYIAALVTHAAIGRTDLFIHHIQQFLVRRA